MHTLLYFSITLTNPSSSSLLYTQCLTFSLFRATNFNVTAQKRLTAKQEAFCVNVFQGMTQRDAWIAAGYSSNYNLAIVDTHACQLFNSDKVQVRFRELQSRAESEAIGTVMERKKRLTEIYRANLTDFVDGDGNIKLEPSAAIAELVTEEHIVDQEASLSIRTKRLKLRDPIAAIAEQNKMERIGAHDNQLPANINIVFAVGNGYQEAVIASVSSSPP